MRNHNQSAPIALFTYNRPWHTRQTVMALQKNQLAAQSELIIYSDAAKNDQAIDAVNEVRAYLKTISGFKSVRIIEQSSNQGLANSIIAGVSEVLDQYGKIIVLEDDIVTSPAFLLFMNQALDFYQYKDQVWHISGWNYPIDGQNLGDVFLWRVMNCWGWATWQDRWQHFNKNPQQLIEQWSKQDIYRFDLDGSGVFWSQIQANARGKLNTWAIFWYATIFEHQGLCVNPSVSYVENIGMDGSGEHCKHRVIKSLTLNESRHTDFETHMNESSLAIERIKDMMEVNTLSKIKLLWSRLWN